MTTIRVIAAVLDVHQLTLYQPDGETFVIPQGDVRVRKILDSITPILTANGVAEVEIYPIAETPYAAFEKKTNGLMKLFRVAKKAVQHLISGDEDRIEPTTIGTVPNKSQKPTTFLDEPYVGEAPDSHVAKTSRAIEEIMAHAEPVSSATFGIKPTTEEQTIVAVVGSGKDAVVLPGVEALKGQFIHANKTGSTKGVEALIQRLGVIIAAGRRNHSVQDVLQFLEKGDLPIADDGSIIAYKILRRHPKEEDTFVDCHTGKIRQKVGDYVCVAEHLVDRNRKNECSNGLHIASRGYLGSFSGDVCVLTKIEPEDVVTVPHRDANKVRVCGYHILALIPPSDFAKLRTNRSMTDSEEAQGLLAQAMSGNHVGRLRQVMVTKQAGQGVEIIELDPDKSKPAKALSQPTQKDKASATSIESIEDPAKVVAPAIDPKQVAKQVAEQKSTAIPAPTKPSQAIQPTRKEAARKLFDARDFNGLFALKKMSKVYWSALGFSASEIDQIMGTEKVVQAAPIKAPMPAPVAKEPFGRKADKATAQKNMDAVLGVPVKAVAPAPLVPVKGTSNYRQVKALELLNRSRNMNHSYSVRRQAAIDLVAFKKTAKVSWVALGINDQLATTVVALSISAKAAVEQASKAKPVETETIATADMNSAKGGGPSISHTVKKSPTTNQGTTKMEGNRAEVARKLFDAALNDRTQWGALWIHKRTAKQSWELLGFSKREIERINNSKPDHV